MTTPSSDTAEKPPFRFFSLPRELRDKIYTALPTQNLSLDKQKNISRGYGLSSIICLSYLLVSRQFGSEYTKAVFPSSTLTIYEPFYSGFEWKDQVIRSVGRIIVYFQLPCEATPSGGSLNRHPSPEDIEADEGSEEEHSFTCNAVTAAGDWVERIAEMRGNLPAHDRLELKIGLYWCSDEEAEWPRHIHAPGLQTQLQAIVEAAWSTSSFELVLFDCETEYKDWEMGDLKMDAWVVWRKGTGWLSGKAWGRRKVDKHGVERVLNDVRYEERQRMIEGTMEAMDEYW